MTLPSPGLGRPIFAGPTAVCSPIQAARATASTRSSWSLSRQAPNVSLAAAVIFTLKLTSSCWSAAASGITKRSLLRVGGRALSVAFGLLLFNLGIRNENWVGILAGLPLAAWCAIPLMQMFVSRRIAVLIGCGTAAVWGAMVFTIFPDAFREADVGAFVVQGVVLFVATAYVLVNLIVDLLYGFLDPRIRYE